MCEDIAKVCTPPDACSTAICVSAAGLGCVDSPVDCNDGSDCTTDTCNPALEDVCVHTVDILANCGADTPCLLKGCSASVGCFDIGVECDDSDACTDDFCDTEVGCTNPSATCTPVSVCYRTSCDGNLGCFQIADNGKLCDDGLVCTAGDVCSEGVCSGASPV
jgi:hypothetical protein